MGRQAALATGMRITSRHADMQRKPVDPFIE
jgi:hypothetical protein